MYVLALDQGTTSSRAILFDRQGDVVKTAQREFDQYFPQPGWVEHDPHQIWDSQIEVARQVLETSGITAEQVAAIGIANQRETVVVWDKVTGEPLANAIVWQDRRTALLCQELKEAGQEGIFRAKTGLLLDPYFSGTKLRWILDNVPAARQKAAAGQLACGTVDSWLVWQLSGGNVHVTDASNASRTLLYNIHSGDWDDELLEILRVPRNILPEVQSSSQVYGMATVAALGAVVPIGGIAGDQQAALFGQMCIAPGMVKNTYGTGGFLLMHTGSTPVGSKNDLLTTVAWQIGGQREYALEGSVFVAGAAVQWLRDGLGLVRSAAEVEGLAASVTDNGGVFMVPAFVGLGAPHWDPYARGIIVGITRGTTAGHLARAALEGIAFQVADVLAAMRQDGSMEIAEIRVDGGAAANDLLLQFQADILGIPVLRPTVLETTARGAAYLAGLAVGYWDSRQSIAAQWSVERRFEATGAVDAAALQAQWQRAVGRAKGWAVPDEA
jgi:glycerol kinase